MDSVALAQVRRASAAKEHGTRARYMAGCGCLPCRAANSRYETERAKARKTGDWNGMVDAAKARRRLLALSKKGVGYKTVADAAGVATSVVFKIRSGERKRIRARTERLLLAVTFEAAGDPTLVDAGPTWRRIEELKRDAGFSNAEIARRMGFKNGALQFGKERVTLRTAVAVEKFWRYYMRPEKNVGHRADAARLEARATGAGVRRG